MENPSIKIGDGKWAIKEGNLLGYSTLDTDFFPIPIGVERASAGTRVNAQGLVETVELLGSEEVTNGDFATDVSGWTEYTNSVISWDNGTLKTANVTQGYGKAYQSFSTQSGKTYRLKFDGFVSTALKFQYRLGSSAIAGSDIKIDDFTSSQSIEILFTATSSTTYLTFVCQDANTGVYVNIDNVSVKEVTQDNLARVDYTGSTSSLLAEPQRTNTITESSDFSSGWSYFDSSTTANQLISPSGVLDASKFTEGSGSSIKRITNLSQYIASGNDYTFSVFAKKGERDFITLTNNTGTADVTTTFDLTNGTVTSGVGSIESFTNGWFRCSRSFTAAATVISNYIVQAYINNGSGISYQGDGTSGIYMWGAQLEQDSFPTSYIPTDGSTVTRVQDQFSRDGISSLINSEEGVLFVEMAAFENPVVSPLNITISDGTASNYIRIELYQDGKVYGNIYNGSSVAQNFSVTQTDFNKVAIQYSSGGSKLFVNGVGVDFAAKNFSANTLNSIQFTAGDGTSSPFFGKVKQLQVYKTALTDTQLAALTS